MQVNRKSVLWLASLPELASQTYSILLYSRASGPYRLPSFCSQIMSCASVFGNSLRFWAVDSHCMMNICVASEELAFPSRRARLTATRMHQARCASSLSGRLVSKAVKKAPLQYWIDQGKINMEFSKDGNRRGCRTDFAQGRQSGLVAGITLFQWILFF